jgi:hypothetical protein
MSPQASISRIEEFDGVERAHRFDGFDGPEERHLDGTQL